MTWPRKSEQHEAHAGTDPPTDPDPRADAGLEALLRAMPLRRPSDQLDPAVYHRLWQARRPSASSLPPLRRWAPAASVAAAVAITFALTIHSLPPRGPLYSGKIVTAALADKTGPATGPRPGPKVATLPRVVAPGGTSRAVEPIGSPPTSPQSVRVIRTLGGVADDGIVGTVNGVPIHRIRRATVQQVVVFDPARGAYVTYRRPTEQVLLFASPAF